MARLRKDNQSGTLGAALTNVGNTITFAAAPGFATLTAPDYYVIELEPGTANYEVVYETAYTNGQITGTILRGQEGTSGVAHSNGVAWTHGPTRYDFTAMGAVRQLLRQTVR